MILRAKEQLKLQIVHKVISGDMDRKSACEVLDINIRTLKRYLKSYREEGIFSVKHGNTKKSPTNKVSNDLRVEVQKLIKEKYYDFNMLHCLEKLKEIDGIEIKRETFRSWCHEIKMVKHKKRRTRKPRYYRQRMTKPGLLLQMDGSHHKWFADIDSVLIAVVDDATSELVHGEFYYSESTLNCMDTLKKVIKKKGLFQSLYVDRAGIYGGQKRASFSQVQRALEKELGVNLLFAHSPEAKGRVERLFKTLQDRLIPEMRLKKIKNIKEANFYLQNTYIPHVHNPRYEVLAEGTGSGYKGCNPAVDLDSVFCIKDYRRIARDHTISLEGEKYLIESKHKKCLHKQYIEIRKTDDKSWEAYFADQKIKLIKIQRARKIAA